jgi:hypothetical protein
VIITLTGFVETVLGRYLDIAILYGDTLYDEMDLKKMKVAAP